MHVAFTDNVATISAKDVTPFHIPAFQLDQFLFFIVSPSKNKLITEIFIPHSLYEKNMQIAEDAKITHEFSIFDTHLFLREKHVNF